MSEQKPALGYFRDLRSYNIAGLAFTAFSVGSLLMEIWFGIRGYRWNAWPRVNRWEIEPLALLTFALSIIGAAGGTGCCLYCAGRQNNIRGIGLSLVAAGLGALGFCVIMIMVN